jgi:hypothetical protein
MRVVRLLAPDTPADELGERRARGVADRATAAVTRSQQGTDLLDCKAWEELGLTGEEFRRNWCEGLYELDVRDEVRALDQLMKTGRWELAGTTTREA